jgi:hypothetical protein
MMIETTLEKFEKLINELLEAGLSGKPGVKGDPRHVKMWLRDECKCVYCGENILCDLVRLTSAQLDHILPKSKYPDYKEEESNWVLACFCCNQIKRNYDPWTELPEEIKSMGLSVESLMNNRNLLIEKCREHLKPHLEKRKNIRNNINKILSEYNLR